MSPEAAVIIAGLCFIIAVLIVFGACRTAKRGDEYQEREWIECETALEPESEAWPFHSTGRERQ